MCNCHRHLDNRSHSHFVCASYFRTILNDWWPYCFLVLRFCPFKRWPPAPESVKFSANAFLHSHFVQFRQFIICLSTSTAICVLNANFCCLIVYSLIRFSIGYCFRFCFCFHSVCSSRRPCVSAVRAVQPTIVKASPHSNSFGQIEIEY